MHSIINIVVKCTLRLIIVYPYNLIKKNDWKLSGSNYI